MSTQDKVIKALVTPLALVVNPWAWGVVSLIGLIRMFA